MLSGNIPLHLITPVPRQPTPPQPEKRNDGFSPQQEQTLKASSAAPLPRIEKIEELHNTIIDQHQDPISRTFLDIQENETHKGHLVDTYA